MAPPKDGNDSESSENPNAVETDRRTRSEIIPYYSQPPPFLPPHHPGTLKSEHVPSSTKARRTSPSSKISEAPDNLSQHDQSHGNPGPSETFQSNDLDDDENSVEKSERTRDTTEAAEAAETKEAYRIAGILTKGNYQLDQRGLTDLLNDTSNHPKSLLKGILTLLDRTERFYHEGQKDRSNLDSNAEDASQVFEEERNQKLSDMIALVHIIDERFVDDNLENIAKDLYGKESVNKDHTWDPYEAYSRGRQRQEYLNQKNHQTSNSRSRSRARSFERDRINHEALEEMMGHSDRSSHEGSSRYTDAPLLGDVRASPSPPFDTFERSENNFEPEIDVLTSDEEISDVTDYIGIQLDKFAHGTETEALGAAINVASFMVHHLKAKHDKAGVSTKLDTAKEREMSGSNARWTRKVGHVLSVFMTNMLHFLGNNDSSVFVIVIVAIGSAMTTAFAIDRPRGGECAPAAGDSDFWATISQSITTVCSSYYLLVPYLRGSEWPLKPTFYVLWLVGTGLATASAFIYVDHWQWSLGFTFGSGVALCVATAMLFTNVEGKRKSRGYKRLESKPAIRERKEVGDRSNQFSDLKQASSSAQSNITSKKRKPRKGSTNIPLQLASPEALKALGYAFEQEVSTLRLCLL